MRALLVGGVLLVASSCGLGVSDNLGGARTFTDGPVDAGPMEHPGDATTGDDVTTDVPGDLPTESEPVDATADATTDAGVDQAEDVPPDEHQADVTTDEKEPDGAQDDAEPDVAADVANDRHEADGANDEQEAGVEGGGGDAGTAPSTCRSSQPFGTPAPVPVLNPGGNLYAARLSPDERVAYFAINTGQAGIFISVRSNRFDPFGPPTPLSAVNDASVTNTPSATADGLVLFFESTRSGPYQFRIYRAVRSFLGAEFSKPVLVTDLGDVPAGGPFVTPDGGALYFHSLRGDTMDLYRAVNNGTGFDPPERLLGVSTDDGDEYAPVVTPDELTIFYQTSAGLMSASRDSLELPFGPPVTLTELDTMKSGTVPQPDWVSLDGCRLYYMQHDDAGTGRLYMARTAAAPLSEAAARAKKRPGDPLSP